MLSHPPQTQIIIFKSYLKIFILFLIVTFFTIYFCLFLLSTSFEYILWLSVQCLYGFPECTNVHRVSVYLFLVLYISFFSSFSYFCCIHITLVFLLSHDIVFIYYSLLEACFFSNESQIQMGGKRSK